MTIKFDKNIPIPEPLIRTKYNFDKMEVGDSKFWPGVGGACGKAASVFSRNNPERKFTVRRTMEPHPDKPGTAPIDGERVWRIE